MGEEKGRITPVSPEKEKSLMRVGGGGCGRGFCYCMEV